MKRDSRALTFTTAMAANTEPACAALAPYLQATLGRPVHYVDDVDWRERQRRLQAGRIAVGWVCGLWYALETEGGKQGRLLAAPVTAGERYGNRPVYFSDVVVAAGSAHRTFASLRGARWAYNEPYSYSGYYVVRRHLAQLGEGGPFFGEVVESGGHAQSLEMVLAGTVDGAAIDSTFLDYLLAEQPALRRALRVVAVLGPSPAPPWVLFGQVTAPLERALRDALLGMHETEAGRAALAAGGLARFAPVADEDYNSIREAMRVAETVHLGR